MLLRRVLLLLWQYKGRRRVARSGRCKSPAIDSLLERTRDLQTCTDDQFRHSFAFHSTMYLYQRSTLCLSLSALSFTFNAVVVSVSGRSTSMILDSKMNRWIVILYRIVFFLRKNQQRFDSLGSEPTSQFSAPRDA